MVSIIANFLENFSETVLICQNENLLFSKPNQDSSRNSSQSTDDRWFLKLFEKESVCLHEFQATLKLPFKKEQLIRVLANKDAFPQNASLNFFPAKPLPPIENDYSDYSSLHKNYIDSENLEFKTNFDGQLLHELEIEIPSSMMTIPIYMQVIAKNYYLVFNVNQ